MSSGGGGTNVTEGTTYTSNLPEYAEPYYHSLLARVGYQSAQPYQPYGGIRLAPMSPYESEADYRLGLLGTSGTNPELTYAGQVAGDVAGGWQSGIQPLGPYAQYEAYAPWIDYQPQSYESQYNPERNFVAYDPERNFVSYDPNEYSSNYEAGRMGLVYRPKDVQADYQAGNLDLSQYLQGPTSRQVGFNPGPWLNDSQMLSSYMNPYMQNVVDIEKREARREAGKTSADIGLNAAGQGSLGGYREAIMQSELNRNLGQQLDDIQKIGSDTAFQQAKQAYEADRAARGQLEQFEQGQFGLNTQARRYIGELMAQGYSAEEAARQAQQQFGLQAWQLSDQSGQASQQFRQQQFQLNQEMAQREEQLRLQGYSAEEANKQALQEFRQRQQQLNHANLQAEQQFRLQQQQINNANLQAAEQFRQSAFGANVGEQQFSAQMQLNAYNAYEQARQNAMQLGLSAAQAEQQGQIARAQVLNQMDQNRLAASNNLMQMSAQQQQMELERLNAMRQAGMGNRAWMQQALDIGYQDFLRQQAYPMEQLTFFDSMLRGLPISPGYTQMKFGQQPSVYSQLFGAGIGGLGAYGMLGGGK